MIVRNRYAAYVFIGMWLTAISPILQVSFVILGFYGQLLSLDLIIGALLALGALIQRFAIDGLRYRQSENELNLFQTRALFAISTYGFVLLELVRAHWYYIDILTAVSIFVLSWILALVIAVAAEFEYGAAKA